MSDKTRLRKGEAKIQFIACGERIAALIASGLDIKATYQQLVKENLITMTYTGFYENYTQRQKKRSRKGRAEAAATLQPASLPPVETASAMPTAAGPPSLPPPPSPGQQNLTASPIKPVLPAPQRMNAPAASDQAERRKAMQELLDASVKKLHAQINDSGDPEEERLKKELI